MAVGDSDTSICNAALVALGELPIIAMTDNTKRATLCNLRYHPVRRRVLRSHPWRCAKARAELAASSTSPLFDWSYAYPKPGDFLRMWDLPSDDKPRWEVEGQSILSDDGPVLQLTYIFDLTDATKMDAQLVDVLGLALAVDICMALTQSVDKRNEIVQRYEGELAQARSASAQEASPVEWDEDVWLRQRR